MDFFTENLKEFDRSAVVNIPMKVVVRLLLKADVVDDDVVVA
jgi:hypothetical protein